ncbi:uncharacterized protein TRIREDRAFT_68184 [Trichoderma reesei QM6a]|uniref:Uncharacterized protein n=2 Tax=Hypocrea jecorina TaxID=51453 RepID=G0RTQ6_HYPJQ|nr:uncharacterized protein TRIREDRAFT_68184 [Trichoderma reesei QM6a]EGR45474.1 hypothetical protein TRIREDRAFT_68184 [Trichoderma reesei QM6a]ETR98633.1 hypothetical protein M419DRAFT_88418 [Trichoderma reesei RUT C-30]
MDKRKGKKKTGGAAPAPISDERFASFQTDPRFRLPSRKHTKTTVDKRFAGILKDDDFTATAKVDKYGRKIKSDSKKKALQRLEEDEEEEEDIEVEDDKVVERELRAASRSRKYDPAREGGFSSSEDSDSDSDSEESVLDLATGGDMQRLEQEEIKTGEVTTRIAVVNLDWDHVKSTDLMALFSSFIPANDGGKVLNVAIYPSEFGKERMQQEELEGPPRQLFKRGKKDEESDDDESVSDSEAEEAAIKKKLIQEGDDQDFDSDALRAYQLDRLRYYYAVMTCSSKSTAQAIYEATDGTEYQASSNFIDLRFVPDDVTFDDEPRDQCDKVPESYKPIEFVTNALQSSKVKLTWDMHPEEINRKESIKRAFKGSRAEIDEQDLKAYLAGDSESDEDEEDDADAGDAAADGEPKLSKKELARRKMREALGLAAEPEATKKSKDAPVGEMEVTFTPALSGEKAKKEDREETTIEKYARKERERKEKKRQAAKAKREALNGGKDDSDDDDDDVHVVHGGGGDDEDGEDLGFNDPFFTTADPAPATKSSIRKEERRKKREAREAAAALDAQEKAHLAKVMAEDKNDSNQAEHLDHFDMNEILRAEKQKGKKAKYQKKKKGKGAGDAPAGLQEDFEIDVKDERFKAVFDSHEFAIDPSNPKFKATEGMKKLLDEGRKKRKMAVGGDEEDQPRDKKSKKGRR